MHHILVCGSSLAAPKDLSFSHHFLFQDQLTLDTGSTQRPQGGTPPKGGFSSISGASPLPHATRRATPVWE